VHPPVDTSFYTPADDEQPTRESHFLIVSALVPYKRLELAIDACARVGAPLRIVGDGPDRERLERLGGQPGRAGVTFLGRATDEQIRDEYRRARAVLLPGEEDFGIVPVEAQACGTPVVALGRGGALETVIDGETGVLFSSLTGPSLAAALERLAASRFDPDRLRRHAERFSRSRYLDEMRAVIDETVSAPTGTRW
jgi:glycosyltransferase involved in cell wall biosynthesis